MDILHDTDFELPREWDLEADKNHCVGNYGAFGEPLLAKMLDEIAGLRLGIDQELKVALCQQFREPLVAALSSSARVELLLQAVTPGELKWRLTYDEMKAVRQVTAAMAFADRVLTRLALRPHECWQAELGNARDYLYCAGRALQEINQAQKHNDGEDTSQTVAA